MSNTRTRNVGGGLGTFRKQGRARFERQVLTDAETHRVERHRQSVAAMHAAAQRAVQ